MRGLAEPARRALLESAAALVRVSGLPALARRTYARDRAAILVYHDPRPETLSRHLAYLSRRYALITLDELVDAIEQHRAPPRRAVVITLDDGHRGNADLLPVLSRHRVRPTLYLCSAVVATDRHFWFVDVPSPQREALKRLPSRERARVLADDFGFVLTAPHADRQALDRAELESMRGLVDFGSHSRYHPVLTTCEDAECEREVAGSRAEIEALVRADCRHFSYPNGDWGGREREAVRRAGYRSARTTDFGWNGRDADLFALRIVGTPDDASVSRLAADLSGVNVGRLGRAFVRALQRTRGCAVRHSGHHANGVRERVYSSW